MPAFAHTRTDHDETLIAQLAAGDLDAPDHARATAQLAACPACAQLHDDLRSIMAATAELPATHRSRDFRLTEADATRLRRTGWRRFLGGFGDPRLAFTRPLATGLVALGIAGLVVASAPALIPTFGAGGAAPAQAPVAGALGPTEATAGPAGNLFGSDSRGSAPDAGGAAPSINPFRSAPPPLPAASSEPPPASAAPPVPGLSSPAASVLPADLGAGGTTALGASTGPVLDQNSGVGESAGAGSGSAISPTPLLIASAALLMVGVGLFLLRWAARRTG
jgi:hypothetical protein